MGFSEKGVIIQKLPGSGLEDGHVTSYMYVQTYQS